MCSFAPPALALGNGDYVTIPYPASLEPSDKTQSHHCSISTCFLRTISGCCYLLPATVTLIYTLSSMPSTCRKPQWLVSSSPCQTSLSPPCSSGHTPQLLPRPHMAAGCFFQHGKTPSLLLSLCPPGTWKSCLCSPHSRCSMNVFF